jgi:S1-C subfamily serine protease
MPSSRAKELCVGEAYSWKKYVAITFLGPQEFESCIFKANALTSTLTVAPGNSGSPTINSMGEVVGVISALNSQIPAGFAMVVPVKFLQDEVK